MDMVSAESLGIVGDPSQVVTPLVIPRSAVLFTGVRSVVYVEVDGEDGMIYEGRTIELGPLAGELYTVRSGLDEGERVVVNGAFRVDSAMQILAKPSMMMPDGGRSGGGGLGSPASDLGSGGDRPKNLRGDSDSIENARDGFELMTQAILDLQDEFGLPGGETLYTAFYPMAFDFKGAKWLQRGAEINNPYFGSYSVFGFSAIYIVFEGGIEFYWSRSRVLEKLNSLPAGTRPDGVSPMLVPDATALGQVFWYTLKPVIYAVRKSNLDVGARTLEVNRVEYIVRGLGFIENPEGLEQTAITARDGTPILIGDIAEVNFGPAQRRGVLAKAGIEAVGGADAGGDERPDAPVVYGC